ncbi:hypothetical protein J2Y49_001484 [Azospirillum sp. BE72]|nr:hypothetical protein [Azospirillum sp. BE72]
MAVPVPLRNDFDAATLRQLTRAFHDSGHVRRLLTPAAIYDREPRSAPAALWAKSVCYTGSGTSSASRHRSRR